MLQTHETNRNRGNLGPYSEWQAHGNSVMDKMEKYEADMKNDENHRYLLTMCCQFYLVVTASVQGKDLMQAKLKYRSFH